MHGPSSGERPPAAWRAAADTGGSPVIGWVVAGGAMAFIVFCADSVGDEEPRPITERVFRALLWMVTLTRWFTHRNLTKLGRFGAVVWFLVTTGWLLTLICDRLSTTAFLVLGPVAMSFVVYCVDALSSDLENKPLRRLLRSVLWPLPVLGYLKNEDSINLVHASVTVWVLLTTGWLLGLLADRIAVPLASLG